MNYRGLNHRELKALRTDSHRNSGGLSQCAPLFHNAGKSDYMGVGTWDREMLEGAIEFNCGEFGSGILCGPPRIAARTLKDDIMSAIS